MKKKLLFVAVVALPVMAATVIKAYNTDKSSLENVSIANIEALANTESTACSGTHHCTYMTDKKCWYYVISADDNKFTTYLDKHIHEGAH